MLIMSEFPLNELKVGGVTLEVIMHSSKLLFTALHWNGWQGLVTDGASTKTLIHDNKYKNLLHNPRNEYSRYYSTTAKSQIASQCNKNDVFVCDGREEDVVVDGGDVDCG